VDRHDWDERYREREFQWTKEPNRFLVECVAALAPGVALDLACGEGRNAAWLAERGWSVTGVDWSIVALQRAREFAARRGVTVDLVTADLAEWTPVPASADLVVVTYLQVGSPLRDSIWERAAAGVRPGGRLVVVGHDSSNLIDGYGGPSDPSVLYTAADVVAAVGSLLAVDRAERVPRPVDTEDGVRIAWDNVVVAVAP
jgi:SAM-dependent methyltransferase